MKPLKERVSISLDPDVIEETKKLAEEADRPFSQYINIVLKYNIKNQKKKQDILWIIYLTTVKILIRY
mgnify:CR=1 FL=1